MMRLSLELHDIGLIHNLKIMINEKNYQLLDDCIKIKRFKHNILKDEFVTRFGISIFFVPLLRPSIFSSSILSFVMLLSIIKFINVFRIRMTLNVSGSKNEFYGMFLLSYFLSKCRFDFDDIL